MPDSTGARSGLLATTRSCGDSTQDLFQRLRRERLSNLSYQPDDCHDGGEGHQKRLSEAYHGVDKLREQLVREGAVPSLRLNGTSFGSITKQHVLRLADLHDRMLCSTLYRGLEFIRKHATNRRAEIPAQARPAARDQRRARAPATSGPSVSACFSAFSFSSGPRGL